MICNLLSKQKSLLDPPSCTQVVSDHQLGKQVGNAMSQNVLAARLKQELFDLSTGLKHHAAMSCTQERLFTVLLPLAGLVPNHPVLHDRWAARCPLEPAQAE